MLPHRFIGFPGKFSESSLHAPKRTATDEYHHIPPIQGGTLFCGLSAGRTSESRITDYRNTRVTFRQNKMAAEASRKLGAAIRVQRSISATIRIPPPPPPPPSLQRACRPSLIVALGRRGSRWVACFATLSCQLSLGCRWIPWNLLRRPEIPDRLTIFTFRSSTIDGRPRGGSSCRISRFPGRTKDGVYGVALHVVWGN